MKVAPKAAELLTQPGLRSVGTPPGRVQARDIHTGGPTSEQVNRPTMLLNNVLDVLLGDAAHVAELDRGSVRDPRDRERVL